MHVALLFPPATDPRGPHLAIPSLAAHLRASGVRVSVHDLDLAGLLSVVQPDRVSVAAERCRRLVTRTTDGARRQRMEAVLPMADFLCDYVGQAPHDLRLRESFLDPHRFRTARETINRSLELVSLASGRVDYSTGPIRYDVDGCRPGRLTDLEQATADPRDNLFDDLYRGDLLPRLAADPADLVGISILNSQQIIPGLTLARMVKQAGHRVVIGGTVYAKFVPELLRKPRFFELFCDALVPYEGETALLELCERVAAGRTIAGVPNVMSLDASGRPALGPVHVEDVKRLLTPDFDGLPLDQYLNPEAVLPILTGKGCYFNRCKFCDIPAINSISKKAYRLRPPEMVAADVAALAPKHGTRFFEITDEALAPNLLLRLDEALAPHQHLEPRFVGYARFEPQFTEQTCARVHAMGVRKLFFGLESGSQRMLDHMDKGVHIETAVDVLRNCRDAGIGVHVFSIVGFPQETDDDAHQTLRFFLDNADTIDRPDASFDLHAFSLDLRTDYYDRAPEFGIELDELEVRRADFPLAADRWRNTAGIDETRARELLAEFHEVLRAALPQWRRFPAHMWPGFEEYSIVYADHYDDAPFEFRFVLPPAGDPTPVGLTWASSTRLRPIDDGIEATCLNGEAIVPKPLAHLLHETVEPMPVDHLLTELARRALAVAGRSIAATDAEARLAGQLRLVIDDVLASGVIELQPLVVPRTGVTA